jgi:hypothetical protein
MSKPNENPVGPAPVATTGPDGSFIEAFDTIRTATRVEAVATGEVLHSHVPKNQQVPFFDLMEQEVQIVQISIPMRIRSFWKNADKTVKLYTEISLTVTDTQQLISLRSDQGNENIQDLHNFAPWGIEHAVVRKIKVDAFGGAGFRDSDIQSDGICVGDIAAWFNVPGSIRSQLYLWETPVFSKGAQFAGRFPESPWGVWFATDELSNNRLHAPVFCGSSMAAFLQSPHGKTAKYDYSKDISDVVDMINPEAESTKVFSNAVTPGRNYRFVDRILGQTKGKLFTTDIDKEAKSLVKSVIAQNIGESYTVL